MRTAAEAKKLLERLKAHQDRQADGYIFPCPRCGQDRMKPKATHNALSRRADVYICDTCGMDEAMRDAAGMEPIPLTEWGMVKGFDENEEE